MSTFLNINWKDVLKGGITAGFTVIVGAIYTYANDFTTTGALPTWQALEHEFLIDGIEK